MNFYLGTPQGNIKDTFQTFWYQLTAYLPAVVEAVIVLLLGWLIAILLSKIVLKALQAIRVDMLADRLGLSHLSQRTGRHLSISRFGEWLVKWFILITTIVAAANILGLPQVSVFLTNRVIPYFGNVVAAVLILLLGMMAANFMSGVVRGAMAAGELTSANALAAITRWAIMVFAVLAALAQLNVAGDFLKDLFRAIVAMIAIAGGIAFGLGGKDHAREVLDVVKRDLNNRR